MTVALRVPATSSAPAMLMRPWHEEDLAALLEAYRDPALRRFTSVPVESHDDALRWLDVRQRGWDAGDYLGFAVLEERDDGDSGEGRLVANVAVKRADRAESSGEVGYWTVAEARGRGVAPRALEAVTVWAFDTFADDGLQCLELLHQVDNAASCRVAEKCGYVYESTLPPHPPFPLDGHLHIRKAR
ncbi:GNAT family N-acetyltransferase [Streptomyces sp. NPDC060064]|uniref:GNAT family N-acetyltransferase n=1 Tax=Streptomyces sp. NPDC060064 TaxID=3347049 RepID=UPI00367393F5